MQRLARPRGHRAVNAVVGGRPVSELPPDAIPAVDGVVLMNQCRPVRSGGRDAAAGPGGVRPGIALSAGAGMGAARVAVPLPRADRRA